MESQLSCLSLSSNIPNIVNLDSLSLRKTFFILRSTNDIISASLVCKHWRASFQETHLKQHIEKCKKRKQPAWVDEALKNNKNIFEMSVAKDRREGLKNWKYKVNITKIAKERPVECGYCYKPGELQAHKDGNSPIIIIDIEYEGVKQKIQWENFIIPTNLQIALVNKNRWSGPWKYCDCGYHLRKLSPPDARYATLKEISELNLDNRIPFLSV